MTPIFSIIIPTFNSSSLLSITLQSVLDQTYHAAFEIIAVDSGSTDHTLEILNSYHNAIRIGATTKNNLYEQINQGIDLAKGIYINVLFPGDFYLHSHTLMDILSEAESHHYPHLVYCATLLRSTNAELKFLYRHLDIDLLRKGQQPTSLQACWFRKDIFEEIGKFSPKYGLRGGFEMLCRFCLAHKFQISSLRRALIEYDLQSITSKNVWDHFKDTFKIVKHYFGWIAVLKWLSRQKDFHRLRLLWIKKLKFSLFGE